MRIATRILLIGLIPIAAELIFFGVFMLLFQQLREQERSVERYRRTTAEIISIRNLIFDQFRYLHQYALDRSNETREEVLACGPRIDGGFARLARLLAVEPAQTARLERLKGLSGKWSRFVVYVLHKFPAGSDSRGSVTFMAGSMVDFSVPEFREAVKDLLDNAEMASRDGELDLERARERLEYWMVFGMAANLLITFLFLASLSRGLSRRVDLLIESMDRYADGSLLLEPVSGDDELSLIDTRFRSMVECLDTVRNRERAILLNVQEVLCSVTADGIITQINESVAGMFAIEAGTVLDQHISKLISHPPACKDLLSCMESVERTEVASTVDLSLPGIAGEYLDVMCSVSWSKPETSFFVVFHDVTLRRQFERFLRESERRLRDMIEAVEAGVVRLDQHLRVQFANSSALRLLGREERALLGRDLDSVLDEIYVSRDEAGSAATGDFVEYHRRGEPFQVIVVRRSAVFGSDERVQIVTLLDITDRVRVERMRADFIAMVSHDLRAPMSSISLFLEMIIEGKYDSSIERLKARSRATFVTAFQLIDMLQNLLDLEKWEQGMFQVSVEELDSKDLCLRSAESLEALAAAGGITINVELESFAVLSDELRTLRILSNLISNAIAHSRKGCTVTVGCARREKFGYFFVDNQGEIISTQEQLEIFKKFRQSGTGRKGGAGLGLTICQQLVQALGGEIGVQSEEGTGTRFWFTLPAP